MCVHEGIGRFGLMEVVVFTSSSVSNILWEGAAHYFDSCVRFGWAGISFERHISSSSVISKP